MKVDQLEMKNELEEQAKRYDSQIEELNLKLNEAVAKVKKVEMESQKQLEVFLNSRAGSRIYFEDFSFALCIFRIFLFRPFDLVMLAVAYLIVLVLQ